MDLQDKIKLVRSNITKIGLNKIYNEVLAETKPTPAHDFYGTEFSYIPKSSYIQDLSLINSVESSIAFTLIDFGKLGLTTDDLADSIGTYNDISISKIIMEGGINDEHISPSYQDYAKILYKKPQFDMIDMPDAWYSMLPIKVDLEEWIRELKSRDSYSQYKQSHPDVDIDAACNNLVKKGIAPDTCKLFLTDIGAVFFDVIESDLTSDILFSKSVVTIEDNSSMVGIFFPAMVMVLKDSDGNDLDCGFISYLNWMDANEEGMMSAQSDSNYGYRDGYHWTINPYHYGTEFYYNWRDAYEYEWYSRFSYEIQQGAMAAGQSDQYYGETGNIFDAGYPSYDEWQNSYDQAWTDSHLE